MNPGFIASVTQVFAPFSVTTPGQQVVIDATTVVTIPAGVTSLFIQAWGGGGQGGGTQTGQGAGGYGGGGAAYAADNIAVTPGSNYTFTIGAGGSTGGAGATGQSGGDTSFVGDAGASVVAKGGTGANNNGTGTVGGAGGQASASTGTTKHSGGQGGNRGSAGVGGSGGGGAAGSTADGGGGLTATSNAGVAGGSGGTVGGGSGGTGGSNLAQNGFDGNVPGGGGGGGSGSNDLARGGFGAHGRIITYFNNVGPTFIASVSQVFTPTVVVGSGAIFDASNSFTVPAGIFFIFTRAWAGGGGGSGQHDNTGGCGGGGGAYAAGNVAVTPGNTYTITVGAGGIGWNPSATTGSGTAGGDSSFIGDSGSSVVAKAGGGGGGQGNNGGPGGQASASTGTIKFSGGHGGNDPGGPAEGGAGGGGAAGDANNGGNGTDTAVSATNGRPGGAGGVSGGGAGGTGGDYDGQAGFPGVVPGGGGGSSGAFASISGGKGGNGAHGRVVIYINNIAVPSIASVTQVYAPTTSISSLGAPFIPSVTVVYSAVILVIQAPFIPSVTVLYAPSVPYLFPPFIASVTTLYPPDYNYRFPLFIHSVTRVRPVFSVFTAATGAGGPGNGGEVTLIQLAPNGTSQSPTLTAALSTSDTIVHLSGDGSLPATGYFCLLIDSEVLYVTKITSGQYAIQHRAGSNTTLAAHASGATAVWSDHYDQAIVAGQGIASNFTADVIGSPSEVYPGWLICFDASQAYIGASRYPMHVTSVLGVFDPGAGASGLNRLDAAQPNSVCTPAAISDNCPAALSNPARISTDILPGDVALVRYQNPEASVMTLGPRSVSLQSWFGLKRVDALNNDVTFSDVNAHVIDGTINAQFLNPSGGGINPDDGSAFATPVAYTTVTMPGTTRTFTYGPPHYSDKGWPIGVLSVRNGTRRVPKWRSWDWHDYNYVYTGFGTDCCFAHLVVNRNGADQDLQPIYNLPGPQNISGPDAMWDDGSYYFGVSWYVAIFATAYFIIGPAVGGSGPPSTGDIPPGGGGGPIIVVTFPPSEPPVIYTPPPLPIEGGSGGGFDPPPGVVGGGGSRFWAQLV